MLIRALLALALCAMTTNTYGQAPRTGNEYLATCEQKQWLAVCITYVTGAVDALLLLRPHVKELEFCMPDGVVTEKQTHDIVMKYLREHPEERHLSVVGSIVLSVKQAFPCQR